MEDLKFLELQRRVGLVIPSLEKCLALKTDNVELHGIQISRAQVRDILTELQKIIDTQSYSDFNTEIIPLPLLIVSDEWRMIQTLINETN